MARSIQVRNVPERLHRALEARAAEAGSSLSEYVLAELRRIAERPTRRELIERIAKLPPVRLHPSAARSVRATRQGR